MQAVTKPRLSDKKIRVALVGHFQFGKSSLVNCLLGRKDLAPEGNGIKSKTGETRPYSFSDDVEIVDTPGFNDCDKRDEAALEAIRSSHCVMIVSRNGKLLSGLYDEWVTRAKAEGKPCVFIVNCFEEKDIDGEWLRRWNPRSDLNAEFCDNDVVRGFLGKNGHGNCLSIDGKLAFPINARWAQYGCGMAVNDEKEIAEMVQFLTSKDGVAMTEAECRRAAFELSNLSALRNFLLNIRLELLSFSLRNKELIFGELVNRFNEEFTKHMK